MTEEHKPSRIWLGIPQSIVVGFVDVIATALLGFAIKFGAAADQVAESVWAIGALIVLSRLMQGYYVKDLYVPTENFIKRVENMIDLNQNMRIDQIRDIARLYLDIREEEFRSVKDLILSETVTKLNKIANDKTSEELPTSEYYSWLLPILENTKPRDVIKAVSLMNSSEWDDSPVERRFVEGNKLAGERKALVERVFIMTESFLAEALEMDPVKLHCSDNKNGLFGFFVNKELLLNNDKALLERAGQGFIIFNGRVALIDNFTETGEVRGYVTMNPTEINKLEKTFEQLKLNSEKMSSTMTSG